MGASTGESMAGANPYVAAGTAGIGVGMEVYNAIKAAKEKRDIAKEIAKQEAVPLNNIADGMTVSRLGADLQKDQAAQMGANQMNALEEGGTRALIGGIGSVTANANNVNAKIAADLDEQQKNIDVIHAQDEGTIRGIKENRSAAKLAALSSQYNAANQNQNMSTANALHGVGSAGQHITNGFYDQNGNPVAKKAYGVGSSGAGVDALNQYSGSLFKNL